MDHVSTLPYKLLSERQAADVLGLTPRTLQSWRGLGIGPAFVRISSRCIRYRSSDIDVWLATKVRASTSSPEPASAS